MAYDDNRAVVIGQKFGQKVERFHVQVVRGLVEHQNVARVTEQAGEQQAVAFAAAEGADGPAGTFRRKQEVLQIT